MNQHLRRIDIDMYLYFEDRLLVCAKNLEEMTHIVFFGVCMWYVSMHLYAIKLYKNESPVALSLSTFHKQLIYILFKNNP